MGKSKRQALKPHEQTFADLYRGGPDEVQGNAKAVYKRLHPRAKAATCRVQGSRMLNSEPVQAYLEEKRRQAETEADVTQERVLRELAALAFYDVGRLFDAKGNLLPLNEMDEQARRAITGMQVETVLVGKDDDQQVVRVTRPRLASKEKGLEMIGRHLKMFTDNVNLTSDPLSELLAKIDGRSKGLPNAGRGG